MRIRIIDAFTHQPFAGNPAGVCLLETPEWPEPVWMQRVAAEMNLSETAFAHPLPNGGRSEADWALRWFTPLVETNLCGHATLATTHALREDGRARETIRFSTMSGVLIAHPNSDGTITLDFPAANPVAATVPDGLAAALGVEPEAVYRTGALGDLLTVLGDEAEVRNLTPDLTAVAQLTRRDGIRGIITTAATAEPSEGYDFVSRFFSPAEGIPEDPVTGSAHTALAPYWVIQLGRDGLTGLQVSARTGLVRTTVHGDRVHLTGHAVTVLEGRLVPAAAGTNGR